MTTNLNPFEISPIIENILVFLNYPDIISAEKINREWRRTTMANWNQRKTIDFRRFLDSNWALANKNTEKRQETIEEAFDWLQRRCPNLTHLCDLRFLPWKASFSQKIAKFHCLTKLEISSSTRKDIYRVISMDILILLHQLAPNLQDLVLHVAFRYYQDDDITFMKELASIFSKMESLVCLEICAFGVQQDHMVKAVCQLPAPENLEILKFFCNYRDLCESAQVVELCNFLKRACRLKNLSSALFCRDPKVSLLLFQSLSASVEELVLPSIRSGFNQQTFEDDDVFGFAAEFHRLINLKKLILDICVQNPMFAKILLENVTPELTSLGVFYIYQTLEFATRFKKLKEVSCEYPFDDAATTQDVIAHLSKLESLEFVNLINFRPSNLSGFNACPNLKGLRCCKPKKAQWSGAMVPLTLEKLIMEPAKLPESFFKRRREKFFRLHGCHFKELCLTPYYGSSENLKSLLKAVAKFCPNLEKFHLIGLWLETLEEIDEKPFQFLAQKCPKLVLLAFAEGIPPALFKGSLPSSVQVVSSSLWCACDGYRLSGWMW